MRDKTLLNVGGIIAIVIGILTCLTIVGAVIGIPAIIGGIKFRDLSTMNDNEIDNNKDTVLVWSIVFIFVCTVSGVLGIIYYIGMENPNLFSSTTPKKESNDKYDELEKLNKLYKEKVLTKEEFEKEKERILSK